MTGKKKPFFSFTLVFLVISIQILMADAAWSDYWVCKYRDCSNEQCLQFTNPYHYWSYTSCTASCQDQCTTDCDCDTTPPSVSVSGAPPNWQNTDATASVSCSDSNCGCDSSTYRLIIYSSNPDTCPTTYSSYSSTSPQTISSHVWVCGAAKDHNGNVGYSAPVEFKVDKTAPTTSITPNGHSWTNQDVSFTLTCSDSGGSGCSTTYYKIINYGETCGTTGYVAGTSGTVTCASESVCKKRVCYYSLDNAGNQEDVKISDFFHIDKQKPNITLELIPEPAISDSSVIFKITCNDSWKYGFGSGCSTTTLTQDLQPYKSCSFNGDGTYSCIFDTPSCIYAAYTYTITSSDVLGNSERVDGTFMVKKASGCACAFDDECHSASCINGVCAASISGPEPPQLILDPSVNVVLGDKSRISFKLKNPNNVPDIMIVKLNVKPQIPWRYWIYFSGHKYDEQYNKQYVYLKPHEERVLHFTVEGNMLTYGTPVEVNVSVKSQNFELTSGDAQVKIDVVQSEAEPAYPKVPGLGMIDLSLIILLAAMYVYKKLN